MLFSFWKTLTDNVNSYSDNFWYIYMCQVIAMLLCCSHHSQPAMTSGLEILPAEVLGRYQSHEKPDGSLVAQNLCKKWMCWEKKSMLKFEVHSGSSWYVCVILRQRKSLEFRWIRIRNSGNFTMNRSPPQQRLSGKSCLHRALNSLGVTLKGPAGEGSLCQIVGATGFGMVWHGLATSWQITANAVLLHCHHC